MHQDRRMREKIPNRSIIEGRRDNSSHPQYQQPDNLPELIHNPIYQFQRAGNIGGSQELDVEFLIQEPLGESRQFAKKGVVLIPLL